MIEVRHSLPAAEVYQPDDTTSKTWMITFTDLVSLMLTFFVLLFSMSNVKIDQWQNIIDSLSRTLNPTIEKTKKEQSTATYNIGSVFRRRAVNLEYLAGVLSDTLKQTEVLAPTRLMLLEDRLVVALPGDLLFEAGRAVMNERARDAMFQLGGILRNIGNQIGVNGHTDPIQPQGGPFHSNWELSTARAAAVANSLRQAGYEEAIVAFGYAQSRFNQLPTNISEAERRVLGRRVDIVILPTVGPS